MSNTIIDELLWQDLNDELSDRAVCELIWQRYSDLVPRGSSLACCPRPKGMGGGPNGPEFIAERPATVKPPAEQAQAAAEGRIELWRLHDDQSRGVNGWLLAWRRLQQDTDAAGLRPEWRLAPWSVEYHLACTVGMRTAMAGARHFSFLPGSTMHADHAAGNTQAQGTPGSTTSHVTRCA